MDKSSWSKDRELFRSILKKYRQEVGLTQSELAEKLGMHQSYVSKVENGERKVDVVEFLLIAQTMGVDPHVLVAEQIRKSSLKLNQ